MAQDGALSFDFEDGLAAQRRRGGGAQPLPQMMYGGGGGSRTEQRPFRQTVCRHWLRGLCMKGDACPFLHQYDVSRLPVCARFAKYGACSEPECPYRHAEEDVRDCNSYKLGFCVQGPHCRFRHLRLQGPPPPAAEVLARLASASGGVAAPRALERTPMQ